jgi:hypothetical protein
VSEFPQAPNNAPWRRPVDDIAYEIADECRRGMAAFPAFNSPHEGWAVIREELDELWDHVKADTGRSPEARKEAIQIAAMALRYVHDLTEGETT